MTAGDNRHRALGLVLQLIAVLELAQPMQRLAYRGQFDFFDTDPHQWVPIALGIAQLATGLWLAYRPSAARLAAIGYALVAVAVAAWVVVDRSHPGAPQADLMMDTIAPRSAFRIFAEVLTLVAWPFTVALAVVLGPVRDRREGGRRPEAGGVLIAYGSMTLARGALQIVAVLLMLSDLRGGMAGFVIPAVFDAGIGLAAIRAGRELVMGTQHGRARVTVVTWLAVIGYPIISVATFGLFAIRDTDGAAVRYFVELGAITAVISLAPFLILRAHAGRIAPTAIELGAPEPEAATIGLGWLMLWYAATFATVLPEILNGRLDGENAVAGIVVVGLIVASGFAFVAAGRGSARRRMWAGIAIAGLALAVVGIAIAFGSLRGALSSEDPMNFIIGLCAAGVVMARLARPSLRDQRGLTSVFE